MDGPAENHRENEMSSAIEKSLFTNNFHKLAKKIQPIAIVFGKFSRKTRFRA